MPIYSYLCECGHAFTKLRPISQYKEKSECEKCKKLANRSIDLPSPGGASPEVWEYEYTHQSRPKYVIDKKGNKLKFNPNTMRKGRKGHG